MLCPKCRTRYDDGRNECPACNVPLVNPATDRSEDETEELVRVLSTNNPTRLALAKSVLQAAGIPHIVQGEAAVNLFPLADEGSQGTARHVGATVLVSRSQLAEAEALLAGPDATSEES